MSDPIPFPLPPAGSRPSVCESDIDAEFLKLAAYNVREAADRLQMARNYLLSRSNLQRQSLVGSIRIAHDQLQQLHRLLCTAARASVAPQPAPKTIC